MEFNIENYINSYINKNDNKIRDKLGRELKEGDTIYLNDFSNLDRNCIKGIITKCFFGLNNYPYIRVNRDCSSYENRRFGYHNKKCNDEKISILCLKYSDDDLVEYH